MTSILLVDDSKAARMMLQHWLKALRPDFRIVEAADGDSALALMEKESPDRGDWLALIDYNMEGMHGTELAERLFSYIPPNCMALCTANIQKAVQERAEKLGIHYLKKPLNPKKIAGLLAQMEPHLASS
ncbi:Response regulator [Sulfidibacter corallicola]|uniref:Response regulator n=1 Tax=Sulfidibacter corallicola TaxID=2818388 RepID=A0A8A4TY03_SULCO|nr:response regulator [Sulfidibacter corallicola]QTD53842.1 response regulator [Sulfidibacter corallicola]